MSTTGRGVNGRVALVTGATGAIGGAIARGLAMRGFEVVVAARDEARGKALAGELDAGGEAPVRAATVDLSRPDSIRALAGGWQGPLHVLLNVAGECPRQRHETPEGVEVQWATNVLGYHRMTRAFQERLIASAPARVVMVASYWAGGLDLEDPELERRPYDNDVAYRQSKQADRMLAAAFARRLREHGVSVNACHPGDVRSRLSASLGFGGHESPEQAAETPLMVATEIPDEATGRYYEHRQERPDRFTRDVDAVEALWQLCESYG